MATQTAPSGVCATCGQHATTSCAGCADTEHTGTQGATFYCSKPCQTKGWLKHKQACQAAQGRKKLFRAAEMIQEIFFALRAELFDLNITKVERAEEGKIDFYDQPFKGRALYGHAALCLDADADAKRAILSYLAGGDVFADGFYDVVVKALKGYTTKVQELDLQVFGHHVRVRRHAQGRPDPPDVQRRLHHVIFVTLKDGSGWIIDPAGAQYGQDRPVVPAPRYNPMFVDKILSCRDYGKSKLYSERFINERHPGDFLNLVAIQLSSNLDHVVDELYEWQLQHGSIEDIIKADSGGYQSRKSMLCTHLVTTAREFIKYANGDPTSTARPINPNANPADLSEEDRLRMQRKQARTMADMDPSIREAVESAKAEGTTVLML